MPDFGDRIRHLRKKRGLTIMDVEKATGIGHSTISRWEMFSTTVMEREFWW